MMSARGSGISGLRVTLPWLLLGLGLLGCRTRGASPSSGAELHAIEEVPWAAPDRVIAEVNGRPITRGDYYHRILRRFGTARMLSGVIKEELFVQEAARSGIRVSSEEVDAKVREEIAGMARDAGGEGELARIYAAEGVSLEDLRRDMAREASGQLLITKVVKSYRRIDDELLRRYYAETYKHTRWKTRHIAYGFVARPGDSEGDQNRRKLEALDKAARAADRIRKGADFAVIARAESEDSVTASRGGEMGFVHEDSPMDPALKAKVLSLAAGEVSDPVENPVGGYHVFQVTEVFPSQGFVDVKETMRAELLNRPPELEEIESVLKALRDRATVKVFLLPAGDEADDARPRPADAGEPAGGKASAKTDSPSGASGEPAVPSTPPAGAGDPDSRPK